MSAQTAARLRLHKDILVRGAGLVLAGGILCAALLAGNILRDPSRALSAPVPVVEAAAQARKDQTRVAGKRTSAAQAISHTGGPGAGSASVGSASAEERTASVKPASGAEPIEEWREQEFTFAAVVDGRTLRAGDVTIRLTGLELPHPDQVCRTLDDRLEQCVARAATQLELLTRSRRLACRYRMTTSSEAIGSCRIGSHDLVERMIRTGYARAADGSRAVVARVGEVEASAP